MVRDITPWFVDNLTRVISGIYFSTRGAGITSRERWIGYLMAWSSVLLAVGGNPSTFMAPEDIQILYTEMRKR